MQKIQQEQVEQIGSERAFSVDSPPALSVESVDELHSTLERIADAFDVAGFKCAKCGLVHQHDTMKHRLSDTFEVDETSASDMDYNSVCHCGLQEAGRHGDDLGIDQERASSLADNAPIPPEAAREMDDSFGSL